MISTVLDIQRCRLPRTLLNLLFVLVLLVLQLHRAALHVLLVHLDVHVDQIQRRVVAELSVQVVRPVFLVQVSLVQRIWRVDRGDPDDDPFARLAADHLEGLRVDLRPNVLQRRGFGVDTGLGD
uniref:(northern house mosquito) hypothetical protein n=1 Tax=Culex pipiens TaxID=7175 RepID=A0A8D8AF56_CULPI